MTAGIRVVTLWSCTQTLLVRSLHGVQWSRALISGENVGCFA